MDVDKHPKPVYTVFTPSTHHPKGWQKKEIMMSSIRNINVLFNQRCKKSSQHALASPSNTYNINIYATEDWLVIGRYQNDVLHSLEIKRTLKSQEKD
jgi:hypothetical protein